MDEKILKDIDHLIGTDEVSEYIQENRELNYFGLIRDEFPSASKLISQVSREVDYDVDAARSFAVNLLEDVNDHIGAEKVAKLFAEEGE